MEKKQIRKKERMRRGKKQGKEKEELEKETV